MMMRRSKGLIPQGNLVRRLSAISDYSGFLSNASLKRQPSAIRALMPLLKIPGMISLGGGMPNPQTFPFKKMIVEVEGGEFIVDKTGFY